MPRHACAYWANVVIGVISKLFLYTLVPFFGLVILCTSAYDTWMIYYFKEQEQYTTLGSIIPVAIIGAVALFTTVMGLELAKIIKESLIMPLLRKSRSIFGCARVKYE